MVNLEVLWGKTTVKAPINITLVVGLPAKGTINNTAETRKKGLRWSGPTCYAEIDDARAEQSFAQRGGALLAFH